LSSPDQIARDGADPCAPSIDHALVGESHQYHQDDDGQSQSDDESQQQMNDHPLKCFHSAYSLEDITDEKVLPIECAVRDAVVNGIRAVRDAVVNGIF
jgi:hypothetical protein